MSMKHRVLSRVVGLIIISAWLILLGVFIHLVIKYA